ncbi:MAG: Hsp20/alpha crystallin family protein [Patescibacteria group bacterium]
MPIFQRTKTKHLETINNEESSLANWLNYEEPETEGQLSIDVYQTPHTIVVKSTIAGVNTDNLKISLHGDLLTIKGSRETAEQIKEEDYLYRECYWGSFSRSIILPAEVDKKVEAELENGILTITLHKINPSEIEVKIKD